MKSKELDFKTNGLDQICNEACIKVENGELDKINAYVYLGQNLSMDRNVLKEVKGHTE